MKVKLHYFLWNIYIRLIVTLQTTCSVNVETCALYIHGHVKNVYSVRDPTVIVLWLR